MKRINLIAFAILLIAIGLGGLAFVKYQNSPHAPSYAQVTTERQQALIGLKAAQNVNESNQQAITNLLNDQATLCAQIKAAKLTQPICNKAE